MYCSCRDSEEEALTEKLRQTTVDVSENDDGTGKEPDAVVNLTFDAEGKLVGAEQEKRTQSATSSGSAQFAIRNSAKNSSTNRKDSIKEKEKNSRSSKKKSVGMKPLSREEQEDFEELQREEEYQRAEQKKIQVSTLTRTYSKFDVYQISSILSVQYPLTFPL